MPSSDGPERTDDGRYIVVKGRRWRAADPLLTEAVSAALRSELGRARSALRTAEDPEEVAGWRARVQLAKEGLGERGPEWWTMTEPARRNRAEERLRALREGEEQRD